MSIKTAIISGITGQDGAYLSQLLLKNNYKVIGLTRGYNKEGLEKLKYLGIDKELVTIACDLTDISSIIKIYLKYQPDEFYNLSAQSSVGLSFEQPIGTIQYNILTVLNILESARILDLPIRFYQASSSEMFGKVEQLPITLKTPMHPVSPYAISKATGYWLGVNYRESYGLYVSNGILFNHESFLRGYNFFVKKIITSAIAIKKKQLDILEVGNIDIKRDLGYAPKYVEAMWLTLQQDKSDDYLICSGESVYLKEVVYYVFDKLNIDRKHIVVSPKLYRPSEITDIYGSNTESKSRLKWEYNYSFFEVLDLLIEEELKNNKI